MKESLVLIPEPEHTETSVSPITELQEGVLHHSEAIYSSAQVVISEESPKFSMRKWWQEKCLTQKLGRTAAALAAVFGTIAVEASPAAADGS